jgi:UDP-N-acetylmuramate--alanine ligase
LESLGVRIVPQDGSGITADTDFVVYSTAIESDNSDIQKAKALNIPLLHRADMLAKLCEGKEVIAIAGTAGKSTVTGLLGWIFQCLGKDPTVYCGAPVLNWQQPSSIVGQASLYPESLCSLGETGDTRSRIREARPTRDMESVGNVRFGTGPWIIEADESDKSFLKFHPHHAIITNIAEDHFSLTELHQLFAQFESQVSGAVVTKPEQFDVKLSILGKHNVENANNALTLCKVLGLDMQKCIEAVGTFKGIERRLERHGPKVIDDFAHSPIKIAAALEAVSSEFPAFSAYWRPHGYTPLFQLADGLVEVFATHSKNRPSDRLFILPVYFAGGTVNIKITSEQFVERLQAAGVPAEFVRDYTVLEEKIIEAGLPVLGMGARDPELPLFAKRTSAVIG